MAIDRKKPPEAHKLWARHLRSMVPGNISVDRWYDEGEQNHIDLFSSQSSEGLVLGTIGLMDVVLSSKEGKELRTELLMDVRGDHPEIANVLSMIAFYVLKDGWRPGPGVVFEQLVELNIPGIHLKHVFFVPPFQWPGGMSAVELGEITIYPLLAVPITDGELDFVGRHGPEALEHLWEETHCDVLDLGRAGAP